VSLTLGEIAQAIDAELEGDPDCPISGVATLQHAVTGQLTFLANRRYMQFLSTTGASAVVLARDDRPACPVNALIADDPYLAYVKAVRLLQPEPAFSPDRHESAVIGDGAKIHPRSFIGAQACLGDGVTIDEHVYIGPGCVLEDGVEVGRDTRLVANVTLCHGARIGQRVLLHPGVVIGADGFGIANDSGNWLKIPQLGRVVVGDDVEVGANTTIDRGALEDTVIEEGVKIDNQVQIGHNVVVGAHTAIAGCVAVAGSVRIGKRCMIGGQSALAGHIDIADDVVITGMSGVSNSIKQAGMYSSGIPVTENKRWRRNIARFLHLDELVRRLKVVEGKLDEITRGDKADGQ
jgi:UDP-3-O-[3-hydroxymyristoyl] glucosamine N-acyltransferase